MDLAKINVFDKEMKFLGKVDRYNLCTQMAVLRKF